MPNTSPLLVTDVQLLHSMCLTGDMPLGVTCRSDLKKWLLKVNSQILNWVDREQLLQTPVIESGLPSASATKTDEAKMTTNPISKTTDVVINNNVIGYDAALITYPELSTLGDTARESEFAPLTWSYLQNAEVLLNRFFDLEEESYFLPRDIQVFRYKLLYQSSESWSTGIKKFTGLERVNLSSVLNLKVEASGNINFRKYFKLDPGCNLLENSEIAVLEASDAMSEDLFGDKKIIDKNAIVSETAKQLQARNVKMHMLQVEQWQATQYYNTGYYQQSYPQRKRKNNNKGTYYPSARQQSQAAAAAAAAVKRPKLE